MYNLINYWNKNMKVLYRAGLLGLFFVFLLTAPKISSAATLDWNQSGDDNAQYSRLKITNLKGKKIKLYTNVTKKNKWVKKLKANKAYYSKTKSFQSKSNKSEWTTKKFRTRPGKVKKLKYNNYTLSWKLKRSKKVKYRIKGMKKNCTKVKIFKSQKKNKMIDFASYGIKKVKVKACYKGKKKRCGKFSKIKTL